MRLKGRAWPGSRLVTPHRGVERADGTAHGLVGLAQTALGLRPLAALAALARSLFGGAARGSKRQPRARRALGRETKAISTLGTGVSGRGGEGVVIASVGKHYADRRGECRPQLTAARLMPVQPGPAWPSPRLHSLVSAGRPSSLAAPCAPRFYFRHPMSPPAPQPAAASSRLAPGLPDFAGGVACIL